MLGRPVLDVVGQSTEVQTEIISADLVFIRSEWGCCLSVRLDF